MLRKTVDEGVPWRSSRSLRQSVLSPVVADYSFFGHKPASVLWLLKSEVVSFENLICRHYFSFFCGWHHQLGPKREDFREGPAISQKPVNNGTCSEQVKRCSACLKVEEAFHSDTRRRVTHCPGPNSSPNCNVKPMLIPAVAQ
jgi:hypothetical protein